MKNLVISNEILQKLVSKHSVTQKEVEQAFLNKCGMHLEDDREDHKSDPPTLWFVAPTNANRLLKVIFIYRDGQIFLRSAFDADNVSQEIYNRLGR